MLGLTISLRMAGVGVERGGCEIRSEPLCFAIGDEVDVRGRGILGLESVKVTRSVVIFAIADGYLEDFLAAGKIRKGFRYKRSRTGREIPAVGPLSAYNGEHSGKVFTRYRKDHAVLVLTDTRGEQPVELVIEFE